MTRVEGNEDREGRPCRILKDKPSTLDSDLNCDG